jgi:hypothetical protein
LYKGVTTIVAVTGLVPLLTAVNDAIFPTPLAGKPIEGVLFTQLYEVATPPKLIAVVLTPLHKISSLGLLTAGVGSTVTTTL